MTQKRQQGRKKKRTQRPLLTNNNNNNTPTTNNKNIQQEMMHLKRNQPISNNITNTTTTTNNNNSDTRQNRQMCDNNNNDLHRNYHHDETTLGCSSSSSSSSISASSVAPPAAAGMEDRHDGRGGGGTQEEEEDPTTTTTVTVEPTTPPVTSDHQHDDPLVVGDVQQEKETEEEFCSSSSLSSSYRGGGGGSGVGRSSSSSSESHTFLGCFTCMFGVGLCVLNVCGQIDTLIGACFSCFTAALLLLFLRTSSLPRMLSSSIIYNFFCCILYVDLMGQLSYFYTSKCAKNGPQFSYTYYQTVTKIVGAVAGLGGTLLFQAVFRNSQYRVAFWSTTVFRVFGSLCDIMIVEGINKKIGLSDKIVYLFGHSVVYNVATMMDFMPSVVLTSKLCSSGLEATTYAIVVGLQHVGATISRQVGVWLSGVMGVEANLQPPCDFSRMSSLLFVGHFVLPLLTVPLTFLLIPEAKLTDPLTA
eukprot:TRINITY_DN66151_c5_g1_i2.p1 TRINITY_DN66151_c5_g1~~TRINITY_DN66151_c5_g1_i2.p1  ORF type:complete len:473 (-),score=105.95 TRINITY_DN66151_c5_g1_i2:547-1965(-)